MLINFNDKLSEPLSVALGYFDCAHTGHREIFKKAKSISENFAVFTIKGNIFKSDDVYGFEDKCLLFSDCGANVIIYADGNEEFFNTSPVDFLEKFTNNFNVKSFVCGEDFSFGKNAEGNVEFLRNYCQRKGIELFVVPTKTFNGEKISSGAIKKLLACGKISLANELLGFPYFINGEVVHGRGEGAKNTVATANIRLDNAKLHLKRGVYATKAIVDGKEFCALTNYGDCPTFACDKESIETHLIDFQGVLYGKKIKVIFLDYLREIKCFSSPSELKKQILKDMEYFQ